MANSLDEEEDRINVENSAVCEKCRICAFDGIREIGLIEYYNGFPSTVYDCEGCGCRFTAHHDDAIYSYMYASADSRYANYRVLADQCKALFHAGDRRSLRDTLCELSKYRYIIEEIERAPRDARLLEIGCSRGHLTSYFILDGRKITGVDVAHEAVESARTAFGDHFVLRGEPAIYAGAPYDVIYHTGTIGCVADPVGMTRELLNLLKPGGQLLFNAPNRNACWFQGQLWVDSAPPPDVITLFPPGFWVSRFAGMANVKERVEVFAPAKNLTIGIKKLLGPVCRHPVPIPLDESRKSSNPQPRMGDRLWRFFERSVRKAGRLTGMARLAPAQPMEFGILVRMSRNEQASFGHAD